MFVSTLLFLCHVPPPPFFLFSFFLPADEEYLLPLFGFESVFTPSKIPLTSMTTLLEQNPPRAMRWGPRQALPCSHLTPEVLPVPPKPPWDRG